MMVIIEILGGLAFTGIVAYGVYNIYKAVDRYLRRNQEVPSNGKID